MCAIILLEPKQQEGLLSVQTRNFKKILLASFTILFILMSCASPDEKANKLYVEAVKLVESAQKVEDTSYRDALKLYKEALAKLERIISKYPSSQIAVKIASGKIKDMKNLKENIIPKVSLKAAAEEDPLACAVMVASASKRGSGNGAFLELAEKCLEVGRRDEALKVLYQFAHFLGDGPKGFEAFSLLCDLIRIQFRLGQKKFLTLLPELEGGLDEEINNRYDKLKVLAEIASLYIEVGQKNKALKVLSKATQLARSMDHPCQRFCVLARIAAFYTELGREDKALEIVSQAMTEKSCRSIALACIAPNIQRLHGINRALEVLSQALNAAQTEQDSASILLAEVALGYARIDQPRQAFQIVQNIRNIRIKGPSRAYYPKFDVLVDIGSKFFWTGERDKAMEVFLEALGIAKAMKDADDRELALRRIACKFAEFGQYERAFELVEMMDRVIDSALILAEIGVSMQKWGKKPTENQSKILHKMIASID